MSSSKFWKCVLFLLTFYCASLISSTTANAFTDGCVNNTQPNFTRCIANYGELYNTLASQDNSFKLESALYPPMGPSSVVVKVTLYGVNGTEKATPVYYTWSLLCLYVALPAKVLELLSLGSILISSRTQELNISVPLFCCSVPIPERERNIQHVLASLQDLAVSPGITDPTLNSAECVVEKHKFIRLGHWIPEMGRHGAFIKGMLWTSLFCTLVTSPLLACFIKEFINVVERPETENRTRNDESVNGSNEMLMTEQDRTTSTTIMTEQQQPQNNKQPEGIKGERLLKSLMFTCVLLLISEYIILVFVLYGGLQDGSLPTEILIALLSNFIENIVVVCCFCRGKEKICKNTFLTLLVLFACNPTIYHLCWLVIGIMINPVWGLSILLVITLICMVITCAFYIFLKNNEKTNISPCIRTKSFWIWLFLVVAFVLFVATVFLAGKSYYGSNAADEWVRVVLWSALSSLTVYVFGKKEKEKKKSEASKTVQNTDARSGTSPPIQ